MLSNNDGCVIARSNEAKALGIGMGDPWHLNREKFEKSGVIVRSSNYTLYGDISGRVATVLRSFTPELEIYSIDEAFLSLDGFHNVEEHVRELRRTVLQWTGIPVSVGIAPTKTLAKAANRIAKKRPQHGGVCSVMTDTEQERALGELGIGDLWGIASRLSARLAQLGIRTPLQLRDADPAWLRERIGVVVERLCLELNGQPCQALVHVTPVNKSILASRSFGRPVTLLSELEEAVIAHATRASEKLRRRNLAARVVMVFVETNRFKTAHEQYAASRLIGLPVASADTRVIARAALLALKRLWRNGINYNKCGVTLLELGDAASVQGDLWTEPDTERSRSLMRTIDRLNADFGRETLKLAGSGLDCGWKLRSEKRSQRYTTHWDEILRV